MKKSKNLISVLLLAVGLIALFLGCREVVRRINDTKQTIQTGTETSIIAESDEPSESTDVSTESDITSESEIADTEANVEATTEITSSEVVQTTEDVSDNTEQSSELSTDNTPAAEEPYVSPYADYFDQYPDLVAWFQIPDTDIDYPVMWTPGDETYYLYRHYDGSDNINGSLLLDTDSSLSPLTTNLIIHGHNMKSGAMFGTLPNYQNESYYEQHKEMLLYTSDIERRYEIVAVFRSQVYKKSDTCFKFYKFFQADTEEEFNDFYDNIKALSLYDTGVTAEFGDHFITLSTCVSHVENGRFVVVAKEITDTE